VRKGMKKGKGISGLINVLIGLVLVAGIALILYPTAGDVMNKVQGQEKVSGYEKTVDHVTPDVEQLFREAEDYNRRLKENPNRLSDPGSTEGYEETLKVDNTGMMGYVTIPSINVRLPFYHGTNEKILETAVGHVEGTTLPIGGPGTHALLSAHRGLPSARLFTDLPKLKVGDEFTVKVLNRTLTYKVDQILTVLPNETDSLLIQGDEDYVTLMTCTPYGVNTHRLLVRGARVGEQ